MTINNIDPEALEALINYAYTSSLEIRVDNVENLLASACLLQVHDVKQACCDFMKKQLHPSNCLGKWLRYLTDGVCDLLILNWLKIFHFYRDLVLTLFKGHAKLQ